MSMQLDQLRNYADALKEALVMRRNQTIDAATDRMLGLIAYNITRWAIIDMVKHQKLDLYHSNDPDFFAQCTLMVVTYFDRVKLDMDATGIVVYLKKVAQSAARDQLLSLSCSKRKHEDVDLESVTITADFYGQKSSILETALEY